MSPNGHNHSTQLLRFPKESLLHMQLTALEFQDLFIFLVWKRATLLGGIITPHIFQVRGLQSFARLLKSHQRRVGARSLDSLLLNKRILGLNFVVVQYFGNLNYLQSCEILFTPNMLAWAHPTSHRRVTLRLDVCD